MPIKAIETGYAGHRFRSRLEARWAVVLDHLNVKWLYEHEGFETEHGFYLPDFWLPDHNTFLEIKGGKPTSEEWNKLSSVASDKNAFASFGLPLSESPLILSVSNRYAPNRPEWPGCVACPGAELLPVAHSPGVEIVCPRCEGWQQLHQEDTSGTSYVHTGEPKVILEDYGHPYVRSRGPITVIPMSTENCLHTWELVIAHHKGDTTMQYVFPNKDNYDPLEWLINLIGSQSAINAGRTARFEHGESPR